MVAEAAQRVYEPCGAIRGLFGCKAPRVLVEGPAGTGKTMGDLWLIRLLCEKYPGSRHWIGRETRASMTDSVLVTLEEKVFGPTHPAILNGPDRENRRVYRHANSEIIVGGLDKPERTFSAEYDTMTVFEAIEVDEGKFELLQRALRNGKMPYQQIKAETNPGAPTHWLNRWADAGNMRRIVTRHEDNPALFNQTTREWTEFGKQYIANLDTLTGHRRDRLRFGKWVAAEGVVYEEFDSRVHVIDAMPTGWEAWTKYRVIDFGFNDPFVCQWWAVNGEAAYLYKEIYMSGRVVEDHARQIKEVNGTDRIEATFADHDREDRETLAKHGVPTNAALKDDILAGIDVVKARLRLNANGKPGFYFLKGCTVETDRRLLDLKRPTSTVAEFDCYTYKQTTDGLAKDKPEDRDNHGMDCVRYLASELDMSTGYGVSYASPPVEVARIADNRAGTDSLTTAPRVRLTDWELGL